MGWWRVARMVMFGIAALTVTVTVTISSVLDVAVRPLEVARSDTAASPFTPEETVALDALARTVALRITAHTCGGEVAGTGIIVDGMIVTSAHLVEGVGEMSVSTTADPASGLVARVHSRSETVDLVGGLVEANLEAALGARSADLAETDPDLGQPVLAVGWGAGGLETLEGRVHLYVDGASYGGVGTAMLIDPATTPGYSGGPVLDRQGRVVAILRSVDLATSLAIAIPVSELHGWLDNPNNGDRSARC